MIDFRITFSLVLIASLTSWPTFATPQHACRHHGRQHWSQPQQRGAVPSYDPEAEITVRGTVDRIWLEDCLGCACDGGTHFTFVTDGGIYEAHLGPSCYLIEKGWDVMKGDEVEVTGALLPRRGGGKAIVVREIQRGDERLVLRDREGVPLWSVAPCR